MKKLIALCLLIGLCVGLLVYNFSLRGLENDTTESAMQSTVPTQPQVGQVRIANRDPELHAAWMAVAQDYTKRTGVPVIVVSGDDTAATLFTVSNQEELAAVKDKCLNLSGTGVHAQLASWDLTLEADGKVCGIAAQIEGFGLIYNSGLLGHLATPQEITGLSALKAVAESITADEELGFAAFSCPDLANGFAARLLSVGVDCRAFWEVYAANAACQPELLRQTTSQDSLDEFLNGNAVFYLGSTTDYEQVSKVGDHNLGMMPLYLGGENEQRQGLCVTCSSYWCVRSDADPLDVQATLDFLNDLVRPRADGTVPVDDLQIIAPYRQATYAANPLERTLRTDLAAGKEYVVCKEDVTVSAALVDALSAYAVEPTDENWAVVAAFLNG
jgi:raffinose/stachyose/melibiose transport system substrate-binding protein